MRWNIIGLALVIAVTLAMSGSASLSSEIFIFAIAALGFNVLYGMTGLLSFGQSVFFGGAAYLSAMLTATLPFSAPLVTLIGGAIGLILAVLFALLATRVRGIYLVMLTLVLQQVGYFLALTFKDYTGGENGLADVVRTDITLFGHVLFDLQSPAAFMIYTACVLIVVFVFIQRLSLAPLGSVLNALRLNEVRTEVLGYRTKYFMISAFAASGFITGMAGSLYAMLMRFVPLNSVDFETAEKLVIMAIVGGVGTTLGPVVGAAIFLLAADLLAPIWPRWLMLMGALMIFVIVVLRGGWWTFWCSVYNSGSRTERRHCRCK
ncbi:branched-chain amino acid ABC transporter permease [Pollutimonas thiosulfatoxidans]|uniref:Branched-chain amino acid ABC transporter permease n=1 Tax=Pollutimonas thiosulfatoxidans TaxID=2028345 RepID=A0A410GEL4_9BURK|nr:branched-chain amino acid ABC transporter permease [Pollutimonas thiosulfatoxidans]QAA94746.1 hypothetical protein CKA81_13500 [Pollutimonas thiosulfatoxidans]